MSKKVFMVGRRMCCVLCVGFVFLFRWFVFVLKICLSWNLGVSVRC